MKGAVRSSRLGAKDTEILCDVPTYKIENGNYLVVPKAGW